MANGFRKNAHTYMKSYLNNRVQRVRVNSSFSGWYKILSGVLQRSFFGPLLFNTFLKDLSLFVTNFDLRNYADGNLLYTSGQKLKEMKQELHCNF